MRTGVGRWVTVHRARVGVGWWVGAGRRSPGAGLRAGGPAAGRRLVRSVEPGGTRARIWLVGRTRVWFGGGSGGGRRGRRRPRAAEGAVVKSVAIVLAPESA
ncbi:hypothetical protein HPP92_024673 [Vanilla planifolia]|uniref:Uncharacterized protein n=1 Tax=Vanilla planifolia TaxID=51239 RepID=A0A835PQR0_VANPL|nr:hypothetical protein HPP92_024967 [Vanilla planifolia]KAG0456885.1 hypothetical protein HPP92_024673 [Vanilla planifolia]